MLDKLLLHTKVVAAFAAGVAVVGTGGAAATVSLASHHGNAAVRSAHHGHESASPSASVSVEPSESEAPEPSESADPEPTESDSPEPTESPTPEPSVSCPSPDGNHGDNVSAVARDKSLHGREHGEAVAKMAHSDCGKSGGDEADEPESGDDQDGDDQGEDADESGQHGHGHGGHGHGHGHHGHGHHG